VELLRPLAGRPLVPVSLQYGERAEEVERARRETGVPLHHDPEALRDLDETAALIAALDCVITVDNTVAHLAGALGRPALVLLSFSPEWRYLARGADMPWYPSLRLLRQPAPGDDWRAVLAGVAAALDRLPGAA
jgi:ADP-heptose:LPS heptosyltransferase